MTGPAGVMALVLAETTAGGAMFLFLTPLWGEVKRGFFYLTGSILLALALGTAGAAAAGYQSGSSGADAVALSLATAGATALWLILMMARARTVARVVGILTVPLSVAMLFAFSRTADESVGLAFFQLLAGALFTGAVLDGLLLGHWYLTDRKLPRGPIVRMAWALIAAVVLEAVAVIAGGFAAPAQAGSAATSALSPILTLAGVASWIAIGMVAATGLIAIFIRLTLTGERPAAVQSATGFFYLAVITAFTAEMAAKVRFLP
ncbi:MAG TPA: hypothetical protein VGH10_02060 [Actinomycetota bacterium]|jgi:hypothetical protein